MELRVPLFPAADRLRELLARQAFVVAGPGTPGLSPEFAGRDPWGYAERLLGVRPRMLERQPIRAVEGGKSFASTSRFTPLHTDSQLHDGGPPDVQIMACMRSAERGGESLLLDTWQMLREMERQEPSLVDALFTVPRLHPFVFGDLTGPTLARRGGSLAFTHSPRSAELDAVGRQLDLWLGRTPPVEVAVRTGETLVLDNRRALHGRRAFDDPERSFVRLLVWLPEPLSRHERWEAQAATWQASHPAPALPGEARRHGWPGRPLPEGEERLALVMAMLRGAPPGGLAARSGVPEPLLYAWREAAIAAARQALDDAPGPPTAGPGSRRFALPRGFPLSCRRDERG